VRCIYASIDDFQAEPALRQWGTTGPSSSLQSVPQCAWQPQRCAAGNWVSSTLLPAECRALYWNLFQAPEREGRIRPQDIAPMGRRSGPQVSYPLRRIVTAVCFLFRNSPQRRPCAVVHSQCSSWWTGFDSAVCMHACMHAAGFATLRTCVILSPIRCV
jgi:hypothetical protein